jgi:carbonic anhydrase
VRIPVQDATLENLGTVIEVIVNGTTTFGNETFATAQFHFHTSGEHYIDGQPYPMEMHIVHESKSMSMIFSFWRRALLTARRRT